MLAILHSYASPCHWNHKSPSTLWYKSVNFFYYNTDQHIYSHNKLLGRGSTTTDHKLSTWVVYLHPLPVYRPGFYYVLYIMSLCICNMLLYVLLYVILLKLCHTCNSSVTYRWARLVPVASNTWLTIYQQSCLWINDTVLLSALCSTACCYESDMNTNVCTAQGDFSSDNIIGFTTTLDPKSDNALALNCKPLSKL